MSILFVANQTVQKQDVGTKKNVTGRWQSRPLNNQQIVANLRKLDFYYISDANSFFNVRASGDGGKTWGQERPLTVVQTDTLLRKTIGFNVSGDDLRFEIRFPQPDKIIVSSWTARMIERSEINI